MGRRASNSKILSLPWLLRVGQGSASAFVLARSLTAKTRQPPDATSAAEGGTNPY